MNVYLDVLLLENTIVNLFLIIITYKILKFKYSFKKAIFISLISSLYSITVVFKELNGLSSFYFQIIVGFIICYFPLKNKNIISSLKCLGVFFCVSFVLGGLCFKFMINSEEYLLLDGVLLSNFSLKYLIIGMIIIFIVLDRIIIFTRDRNILNNFFYDLKVYIDEEEIRVNSFLDTGNELREPITNLPCILIEKEFIKKDYLNRKDLYYIPYKAIGYEGKLIGIKAKSVQIRKKNNNWEDIEAIVCICNEKLSKENNFNALLSRGVL